MCSKAEPTRDVSLQTDAKTPEYLVLLPNTGKEWNRIKKPNLPFWDFYLLIYSVRALLPYRSKMPFTTEFLIAAHTKMKRTTPNSVCSLNTTYSSRQSGRPLHSFLDIFWQIWMSQKAVLLFLVELFRSPASELNDNSSVDCTRTPHVLLPSVSISARFGQCWEVVTLLQWGSPYF